MCTVERTFGRVFLSHIYISALRAPCHWVLPWHRKWPGGTLVGRGVWGRMDTCMCLTGSLHCSPETITTLLTCDVCVLAAQPRPTLCGPTNCSLPGFSVRGILQARILEWDAIPFSRLIGYTPMQNKKVFKITRISTAGLFFPLKCWPHQESVLPWTPSGSFSLAPSSAPATMCPATNMLTGGGGPTRQVINPSLI